MDSRSSQWTDHHHHNSNNYSNHNKYDPNVIIRAAEEKLVNEQDFEGGQWIYQSALLDWVDDAREGGVVTDPEQIREATATLWLAYVHYLVQAKQFKSAFEAYEQAVSCPVAGSVGRVWLDYARFAEERGKYRTAQDVYMRALVGDSSNTTTSEDHTGTGGQHQTSSFSAAVTDEQDQALLWDEFLRMTRQQQGQPTLTMMELQSAVSQRRATQNSKNQPSLAESTTTTLLPDFILSASADDQEDHNDPTTNMDDALHTVPAAKRPRLEENERPLSAVPPSSASILAPSRTHVVTAEAVAVEAAAFLELLRPSSVSTAGGLPPDVAAAWMIRDGTGPAQSPEPPLFGPSPPKLSDPTAKDILGVPLALQLVERILSPTSGNLLLDVCRGLWAMQGLKEKEATSAIDRLDESMLQQAEQRQAHWNERAAVAGHNLAAVQHMIDSERRNFEATCSQQRQMLLNNMAWEFRQLLCVQQQILTKLDVPGFRGPTVDAAEIDLQSRICSYLHSAFYLRKRIGEEPHLTMLKSQLQRLQKEKQEAPPSSSIRGETHSPVVSSLSSAPPSIPQAAMGGMSGYMYSVPQQLPPPLPMQGMMMPPPAEYNDIYGLHQGGASQIQPLMPGVRPPPYGGPQYPYYQ